ncbi:MAG TPA: DUF4185 domain-containing protein [Longimicrobiales bacterium]
MGHASRRAAASRRARFLHSVRTTHTRGFALIRLAFIFTVAGLAANCWDSGVEPPGQEEPDPGQNPGEDPDGNDPGAGGVAQLRLRADLTSTVIATLVVQVAAPDIDPPLEFTLEREGDAAAGTLEIPAGSDRVLTASAYDASGVRTHVGSDTLTLVAGTNPTVTLELSPLVGELPVEVVLGSRLIIVSPGADTVQVGDTTRFHAVIVGAEGDTLDGEVQWASGNTDLATVNQDGLVTARAEGTVDIIAVNGAVAGEATLEIEAAPVPPDTTDPVPPDTVTPPDTITYPAPDGAPYPGSPVIADIRFDWSTHRREAPGSDNWPLTWADDGHQYTSWGDGGGFGGTNTNGRVDMGIARIEGGKRGYVGININGGEDPESGNSTWPDDNRGMKTYALLSVNGGVLYTFLSPLSDVNNWRFARLAKSTDHGATWTEIPSVEFTKEQGLALPWFLQAGQDYGAAEDDYVYVYFTEVQDPTIWEVQKPGRIALARVPRDAIEDRGRYEFFAGLDDAGNPTWTSDVTQREPVFEDRNGVMRQSTLYNPVLDRYLLITSHTARNYGNIGIFDAPHPWGPWTTVEYAYGWPRGGEIEGNSFYWNFSPKWWSADGLDFVLVFTGKTVNDSWNSVEGSLVLR